MDISLDDIQGFFDQYGKVSWLERFAWLRIVNCAVVFTCECFYLLVICLAGARSDAESSCGQNLQGGCGLSSSCISISLC